MELSPLLWQITAMSPDYSNSKRDLMPPLWVLGLMALGLALWLVWRLQEIMVLLVVGYCIAYLIDPCLTWLAQKRISRPFGIVLLCLLALSVLALMLLTAVPVILREYTKLVNFLPSYVQTFEERFLPLVTPYLPAWPVNIDDLRGQLSNLSGVAPQILTRVMQGAGTALLSGYSVGMTLLNLLLLPFIVYYLALDFRQMHLSALKLFPILKREHIKAFFLEIDSYVSAFVRGQLIVCCILALLYALGLGIVGVELWPLLALISGFGNLIPYLGFIVGIVCSSIMALITFGDLWHVVQIWGVYALVQFLEGSFISPKIVGDSVGLSPLVVILAVVIGGSLFGLLGIFLAVPGAAVLKVVLSHAREYVVQAL